MNNTHGDTKPQCHDLKKQVEVLVRNYYLNKYIDSSYPMTDQQCIQQKRILVI